MAEAPPVQGGTQAAHISTAIRIETDVGWHWQSQWTSHLFRNGLRAVYVPSRPVAMLCIRVFVIRARRFDVRHGATLFRHVNRRNNNSITNVSTSMSLRHRLARRPGERQPAAWVCCHAALPYKPTNRK